MDRLSIVRSVAAGVEEVAPAVGAFVRELTGVGRKASSAAHRAEESILHPMDDAVRNVLKGKTVNAAETRYSSGTDEEVRKLLTGFVTPATGRSDAAALTAILKDSPTPQAGAQFLQTHPQAFRNLSTLIARSDRFPSNAMFDRLPQAFPEDLDRAYRIHRQSASALLGPQERLGHAFTLKDAESEAAHVLWKSVKNSQEGAELLAANPNLVRSVSNMADRDKFNFSFLLNNRVQSADSSKHMQSGLEAYVGGKVEQLSPTGASMLVKDGIAKYYGANVDSPKLRAVGLVLQQKGADEAGISFIRSNPQSIDDIASRLKLGLN